MTDDSPTPPSLAQDLQRYLQRTREALVWKLEGLSEYDVRRPLTPTGTNLLGLVQHCAACEFGYFGDALGRPYADEIPWLVEDPETVLGPWWENADLWVAPQTSREDVLAFYRRAWAHTDAAVAELPLDAPASVPWWPEATRRTTFGRLLVHVIADTTRHAGHADVLREQLDGAVGLRPGVSNVPDHDAAWWSGYRAQVEAAARAAEAR